MTILQQEVPQADESDCGLLKPAEVAVRLNRSQTWVWRAMRDGRLASVITRGGRRIPLAAVLELQGRTLEEDEYEREWHAFSRAVLDAAVKAGILRERPPAEALRRVARLIEALDS